MMEEGGFPPPGWTVLKRNNDGGCYLKPNDMIEDDTPRHLRPRKKIQPPPPKPSIDWKEVHGKFWHSVDHDRVSALAKQLGLKEVYLRVIGLGWCAGKKAWSFPMHSDHNTIIGIRLRTDDGAKFAIAGSRAGVFMNPIPFAGWKDHECVFVCEGPTDTAAAWQLGLFAIGRPSASGGVDILKKLLSGKRTVIVSDSDSPGRAGAETLAAELLPIVPSVKIIEPPTNDMRDWVANGATRDEVDLLVDKAKEWSNHARTARKVQGQPT